MHAVVHAFIVQWTRTGCHEAWAKGGNLAVHTIISVPWKQQLQMLNKQEGGGGDY